MLYPFFLDGVAGDAKLNQGDGIHPTAAGVDAMVTGILPKVEELIAACAAKALVSRTVCHIPVLSAAKSGRDPLNSAPAGLELTMPRLFTGLEFPRSRPVAAPCCAAGCPARAGSTRKIITSRCASSAMSTTASRTRSRRCSAGSAAQRSSCGFDGLSSFGGRKPRAMIATVAPSQALMELQAEHERLMQRVGLEPEGRKYTPHVTLARLRDSSSRAGRRLSFDARAVPLAAVPGVALRAVLLARLGRRRPLCGRGGLSAGGVAHDPEKWVPGFGRDMRKQKALLQPKSIAA